MSVRLEPGTPAPAFTLADASGKEHSLSDYAGSKVILYFYPRLRLRVARRRRAISAIIWRR